MTGAVLLWDRRDLRPERFSYTHPPTTHRIPPCAVNSYAVHLAGACAPGSDAYGGSFVLPHHPHAIAYPSDSRYRDTCCLHLPDSAGNHAVMSPRSARRGGSWAPARLHVWQAGARDKKPCGPERASRSANAQAGRPGALARRSEERRASPHAPHLPATYAGRSVPGSAHKAFFHAPRVPCHEIPGRTASTTPQIPQLGT